MFFGIAKRDEDVEVTVKMISNGYLIRANGRSSDNDWITKEVYAESRHRVEEFLTLIFDLPTD